MPATPFTIDFTSPAAPTALAVTPLAFSFDPAANYSSHRLTWVPVSTAPENIARIEIWSIDVYQTTRIAWFTDPSVATFDYHFPRFSTPIEYQIHQIVRAAGGGTLTGLWGNIAGNTIANRCLSIVSVINPVAHRITFEAWSDFGEQLTQSQEWQIPAGGQNYFEVGGSLRGRDMNLSVMMHNRSDGVTALQEKIALETIFDAIPPETMCLRHPRGGKWFGRFNGNWSLPYIYGGERYSASGGFRRTSFKEGN
jgi:hypothetical protein